MNRKNNCFLRQGKLFIIEFIVIILGFFDAVILWVSLHPKVTPLYNEYYLKHTLSAEEFIAKMKQKYPMGASPTDTSDSKL